MILADVEERSVSRGSRTLRWLALIISLSKQDLSSSTFGLRREYKGEEPSISPSLMFEKGRETAADTEDSPRSGYYMNENKQQAGFM